MVERRLTVLALIVLLWGGAILKNLIKLQIVQHQEYATRSEANRIKPRPVVPARGLIYDRKGRLLADNVPAYRLEVTPNETTGIKETLAELARLLQGCSAFIGHDSGISHLGAALGLPGIILWGETREEVWRPPHDRVVLIKNSEGINGITVEQILSELGRMPDT